MDIRSKARQLRKDQTDAEQRMWRHLRDRACHGYKFRRQVPVAGYIVDFLCVELKLVIEIDGGQHALREEYDSERTCALNAMGYQVMRIWNNDVLADAGSILEALTLTLSQRERGSKGEV